MIALIIIVVFGLAYLVPIFSPECQNRLIFINQSKQKKHEDTPDEKEKPNLYNVSLI